MDTDFSSLFWFVVPFVAVPSALTVLAFRSPSPHQLSRWADGVGVVLTDANREAARRHLARGRRWRALAALPLWWLAGWSTISPDPLPAGLGTPWIGLAAYLCGALLAEAVPAPFPDGAGRGASLVPRSVADYVPGWVRPLPWAIWSLAVAGLALGHALDVDAITHPQTVRFGDPDPQIALGVAFVVLLAAEAVIRRVVRRPQRSVDVDLLAVDDGLRATGVAAAVAGGLVAALAAFQMVWLAASHDAQGRWSLLSLVDLGVLGLLCGAISCVSNQLNWGYRRRHRQAAAGPTVAQPPPPPPPSKPIVGPDGRLPGAPGVST